MAASAALLVVVVPWVLPTGPSTGLDVSSFLTSGRFAMAMGLVFLGGLLTALTPCVYPLIPITVSVFGARRAESRGKALMVTTSYVLGMATVFTALGVVAAKAGQAFGSQLGNPVVVLSLAALMLVLAASMFGAYELALPQAVTQRLNSVGGAGVAGAFLMGSVSGFLAAPCTGPVLSSLLAFVAKSQNVSLGAGLMFVYALGIGFPFFLMGVFVVRMPKSGVWMEWVKSVLGIALVALAALYIRDAFPQLRAGLENVGEKLGEQPTGILAAALAALGVTLGAIHLSFKEAKSQALLKGLGVALMAFAIVLRISSMHAPASGSAWSQNGVAEASERGFRWNVVIPSSVANVGPFDEALARAKAENKPVLVDFFAEWCAACKELDRETYPASKIVSEGNRFVKIKVDGTTETDAIEALYSRYKVVGLPTVIFISSKGEVMNDPRITGFLEADEFLTELQKVQ